VDDEERFARLLDAEAVLPQDRLATAPLRLECVTVLQGLVEQHKASSAGTALFARGSSELDLVGAPPVRLHHRRCGPGSRQLRCRSCQSFRVQQV
jgi:hypothetical protein